ncbi:glycosyltransferase family 2 protein [Acetobacter orientalis]|uniref:glycosyltransferase family 2 protein n=1 Tax=Acetobacter orientalis TaxID=146474 RepID=UPI00264D2F8F|nr:glycosyltransferase family 2 protein [Acetobacter sp.]
MAAYQAPQTLPTLYQRIRAGLWRMVRSTARHLTPRQRPLAVFTMVYNEHTLLPLWAAYFVRQVGAGNVYVLDHGSDSLPPLPGCTIVPIPRLDVDEIQRTWQVQRFQRALLQRYKFVLFTDCDEFVVARPSRYPTLRAYAQQTPYQRIRCVGVDVVQHAPDLPPVTWHKPILVQRPYGAIRPWSCKTLLSSVPLSWQPGFHSCDQPSVLDTDLWMFHLKYADQTHLLKRLALTRSLNWSARAISLGHGNSHRAQDQAMLNFLEQMQATRSDTDLESLDIENTVQHGEDTDLHRIPEAFLHAF